MKATQPDLLVNETDDKVARVNVRLDGETVWLTQQQLSELYGTSRPNVTMHIKNIFSAALLSRLGSSVPEELTALGNLDLLTDERD